MECAKIRIHYFVIFFENEKIHIFINEPIMKKIFFIVYPEMLLNRTSFIIPSIMNKVSYSTLRAFFKSI